MSLGRSALVGKWASAKGYEEGEARVENGRMWGWCAVDVNW